MIFSKNLNSRICPKVGSDYPRGTCENVVYHFHGTIQIIVTSYMTPVLTQAGLTSLEIKFTEWEWEEELHVFTLEEVGLGKTFCRMKPIHYLSSFSFDNKCCWTWNINNSFYD